MTAALAATRPSPIPVFEHLLVQYRGPGAARCPARSSLPILFLLGMGLSVGAYVDRGGDARRAVPRLHRARPARLDRAADRDRRVDLADARPRSSGSGSTSPCRPRRCARATSSSGRSCSSWCGPPCARPGFWSRWPVRHGRTRGGRWPRCRSVCCSPRPASLPVLAFSATIKSDNMFALIFRFVGDPDDPVRRRVLPGFGACRWWPGGSRTPRRCGTASSCAGPRRWAIPAPCSAGWHVGYLGLWPSAATALARRRFARRLTDGGS